MSTRRSGFDPLGTLGISRRRPDFDEEALLPRYRPDLEDIPTYSPGRPTAEIAAELGIDTIAELASNECPVTPIPEIQEAVAKAISSVNRYPLSDSNHVVAKLSEFYDVAMDRIWVGPGSTAILTTIALAASGPGSSIIFADPSFIVYRMAALLAGAEPIPVPVDSDWRLDPEAMAAAVRPDTAVIYYCNPNNPTSTHSSDADVNQLIESVPESVTIVIDEAYAEFVNAPDYRSALPLAQEHDNVIVSRTFSKVYGLAGVRIGYAMGDPTTIKSLRRPQPPYATGALAQVAAVEALRHQDVVASRVAANAKGRQMLVEQLRLLGERALDSQTNFVLWEPATDPGPLTTKLLTAGVMVRPIGQWIRITVGSEAENSRAVAAIAELV